jgi:hypothetical protein
MSPIKRCNTTTGQFPAGHQASEATYRALNDRLAEDRNGQWLRTQWASSGPHAHAAQLGRVAPGVAGALWFDGLSFGLTPVIHPGAPTAFVPTAVGADGYVGINPDVVLTHANGDQVLIDPFLGAWDSFLGGGLSVGYYNHAAHMGLRIGLQNSVAAKASSLSGAAVDSPAAANPQVTHTLSRRLGMTSGIFLGVACGFARALCKIDRGRVCENTYSTTLPQNVSVALDDSGAYEVKRTHVIIRWLRRVWAALRRSEPLAMPNITSPKSLQVGDVRRLSQEKSWLFMPPAPGCGFVYVGSQLSFAKRHTVQVQCTAKDTFEVTVRCDTVRSRRLFGMVPGGLFADFGRAKPGMQEWVFEFADPQICQDWVKKFVRPGNELQAHIDACPQAWHTHRQITAASQFGHEAGMRFSLFPKDVWREILPKGFGLGLSQEKSHVQLQMLQETRGKGGVQRHISHLLAQDLAHVAGPLGHGEDSVRAIVSAQDNDAASGCLTLVASFSRSRATGDEINQAMVAPLNTHLGLGLSPMGQSLLRSSREVQATYSLSAKQIMALDSAALLKSAEKINLRAAQKLRAAFSDNGSVSDSGNNACERRALAVAHFVQTHGLAAMGAVVHLAAPGAEVQLHSSSAAYERLETELTTLQRRYPRPLNALEVDGAHLLRRLADVEAALWEVEQTRGLLSHDTLLRKDEVQQGLALCEQTQAQLRALLQTSGRGQIAVGNRRQLRRLLKTTSLSSAQRARYLLVFDPGAQRLLQRQANLQLGGAAAALSSACLQRLEALQRRDLQEHIALLHQDILLSPNSRAAQRLAVEAALAAKPGAPDPAPPTATDGALTAAVVAVQRRALKLHWRPPFGLGATQKKRLVLQAHSGKAVRRADDLLTAVRQAQGVADAAQCHRQVAAVRKLLRRQEPAAALACSQALVRLHDFESLLSSAQSRQQARTDKLTRSLAEQNTQRVPSV